MSTLGSIEVLRLAGGHREVRQRDASGEKHWQWDSRRGFLRRDGSKGPWMTVKRDEVPRAVRESLGYHEPKQEP
jgi:hypothetical protein